MTQTGSETDDLLQAAWLYHVGQMSQEEVSRRLGISRFKVLRLLAEARDRGLVRVSIEHETTGTLALADRLAARFALTEAQVAPMPGGITDAAMARRAVGIVAAGFLARIGRGDTGLTIGLGWGRTLAAMAEALTGLRNPGLRFVSLMGSMARTSDTSPFDVCARLAALTGGSAMFLPAPFLADSEADCTVILNQRLVRETLEAARAAQHAIISVGECTPDALLYTSGILTAAEARALRAAKAVADSTGKFFRADGSLAETDLNRRAPSIRLADLRRTDVTLLAAGTAKARATLAVLRAGFVNRVIADEALARALLDLQASEEQGEDA
ncbi:sugar-binding domain-containing protein [Paracoccaceae bacterium Fryx2]|nr:sugar-binding domain-containing protein [Paracoccaceae bacterium Fryx2]